MTTDEKAVLHRYLRSGREALLWKLEGLSEYDVRRPLVPTGTNLLGLVKHLAGVEAGYFGATFGRPLPGGLPWSWEASGPQVDMWATAEETRQEIVGLYRRACEHADSTISGLPLGAIGTVPHWPPTRGTTTLHHILVHVIAETHRHAGQADIVRELVDGGAGLQPGNENVPPMEEQSWRDHREAVERAALAWRDEARS